MTKLYGFSKEIIELRKVKRLAKHGQRTEAIKIIDEVFHAVKERERLYPIKIVQLTNPELMHVDTYGNKAMQYKNMALSGLQDIRREFSHENINTKLINHMVTRLDDTKFYSIPTIEKLEGFQTVNNNRPIKIEYISI